VTAYLGGIAAHVSAHADDFKTGALKRQREANLSLPCPSKHVPMDTHRSIAIG